ncbi:MULTISPECIES: erythromycin esterase family protein [Halorussus]|uniref:erythromycin esterase family protein n=1 Tax=Halorussus TaxID=1070314 RepID=UPI00209FA0A2|nr:erythromycin esterase family protein [Halorussus vallis]USZ77768.1 erythromycin esterase family protein [Halorussus vallis]
MSGTKEDLLSSLSELAVPFPNADELTATDLPDGLRSRLDDATVIGLGEASHGTEEFYELRFRLIRLLVEEFGVRAVGIEAGFDPLCRVNDLIVSGEGDIRSLLVEIDDYRTVKTETMADLFEWLQSFNASRPPEDRVYLYGFDMTIIENATNGLRSYLERVDADVEESILADLDTMTTGYDSDDERQALVESARRVHSTLKPMLDANESAWVEADSRQAYERVRHRLHLIDRQLEAHERDHEGRMALRDETMAETVEWIHDRSTGPVVLWGHNGHLNRGRHVLGEWEVDVRSMGEWLADSYGERYCPVGFELGAGTVVALDGRTEDIVEHPIPDPPSGSIPDVLGQVDEPLFYLSVDDLYDDSSIEEWLRTRPRRHDIWGGTPDGDNPVKYRPSDLGEFDGLLFVRETSPLVHLD